MSAPTGQPAAPLQQPLPAPKTFMGIANFGDRVFKGICQAACLIILLVVVLLVIVLIQQALPAAEETGLGFFSRKWDPRNNLFGALSFIFGTLITSALAMLIAVPLGVGTAAYLSEIAPAWVRRIVTFAVEMLAAIPSVVYGFWGMKVLAPLVGELAEAVGSTNVSGHGILACSLVLAIMILPYVTAVSYDVCRAVPSSQRQAALALGATRWQTIRTAVLPYARPGIVAASFIALGRALGETMAATMLIGNDPVINWSIFGLGDTMASRIASNWNEAVSDPLYRSALVQLGLLLLLVTLVVNVAARLLIWRMGKPRRTRSLRELLFGGVVSNGRMGTAEHVPLPTHNRWARASDRIMTGVLVACTLGSIIPLFFIFGYLLFKGVSSLHWAFFTNLPLEVPSGIANALYGSGLMVGMATLLAVPIGLFAAVYLAEYRNGPLARSTRFIAELLGGVPSIVIGIFGYTMVVLPLSDWTKDWGEFKITFCAWAGAFALGVMMIPIVMRASEEALRLVPRAVRHASMALGANNWQTVMRITVPAALPAIVTAIFLAIARVAGETAPLLLTAGDNRFWPNSPNDNTPSIPLVIYNYSRDPNPEKVQMAWAAALVLMVLVLLLNFGIRWVTGKRVVLAAHAD
jgi:phosphate transport system permease protein